MKGNRINNHFPFLNNWGIEAEQVEYTLNDLQQAAQLLSEGNILGVYNGYGEARPRALGNRSIIALPSQALINTSFNAQGEPLVHTTADTMKTAQEIGVDWVVINGKVMAIGYWILDTGYWILDIRL